MQLAPEQLITYAVLGLTTAVNIVIAIRKPNEDQNLRIKTLELESTGHKEHLDEIRKSLASLSTTFTLFKENEFRHLEKDMNELRLDFSKKFEKLITILGERLPHKSNGSKA